MTAARTSGRTRQVFVVLEVTLLLAIPLLGYAGFRTLLDTRTGTFIENPGPDDPGWLALVDPSPLTTVVEVGDQGTVTGLAVIAELGESTTGGAVILIPAEMVFAEKKLASLSPVDAAAVVEDILKLRIPAIEVVDAQRWAQLLQDTTYSFQNPDPVPDATGAVVFGVGEVEVDGGRAALFLGRTGEGADPLAALVRRELFWTELLAKPPPIGTDPLGRVLHTVADGSHEVVVVPFARSVGGTPEPLVDEVEALVNRVVPFPVAGDVGERYQATVEDRTGSADLDQIASNLAGRGVEVVAIANGSVFDNALTAIRVSPEFTGREALSEFFSGIPVVTDVSMSPSDPVVLQLGPDFQQALALVVP